MVLWTDFEPVHCKFDLLEHRTLLWYLKVIGEILKFTNAYGLDAHTLTNTAMEGHESYAGLKYKDWRNVNPRVISVAATLPN